MKIKKIVLSCLTGFIAISGAVLGVYYTKQSIQSGIVVKKEAQLFAAPNKGFHALCPVVYAHNVTVKEREKGGIKFDMLI